MPLIQQSEHPQWNPVSRLDFQVIHSKVAVGNVFDLPESLVPAPHFEHVLTVYQKISGARVGNFMGLFQLVSEERLPDIARVGITGQGKSQVRILQIHLFRLAQLSQIVLFVVKHVNQCNLMKPVQHTKHGLARSFNLPAETGQVQCERHHPGHQREQAFHLCRGDVFHFSTTGRSKSIVMVAVLGNTARKKVLIMSGLSSTRRE